MVRLVQSLAFLPPSLAVGTEELLQPSVVVDASDALMVLVTQSDCAALSLANRASGRWVDVMALSVRAVTDEASIVHWVQAWLLAHIDPVPACPHSRDNCSLMIRISSFMALIASTLAL